MHDNDSICNGEAGDDKNARPTNRPTKLPFSIANHDVGRKKRGKITKDEENNDLIQGM